MDTAIIFDRVEDPSTPQAVTLTIRRRGALVLAQATWPAVELGGLHQEPGLEPERPVPDALRSAIEVVNRFRFDRIVVDIEDAGLWDERWGVLRD
ncbi:hypothetical protein [Mangrovibrevibacter kandeliae]|uniref:hypothetical protein n=1 Tax=Mangrovibrevibacter kandeliae TaxID=2968473 RepID=UPI00211854F5|nr:hypothetical protein [Aurantimonas sp. CSK15Z-1]MCQ8781305.1 hypothetical protein [Aurantimonas sp. CSK15Z-1]